MPVRHTRKKGKRTIKHRRGKTHKHRRGRTHKRFSYSKRRHSNKKLRGGDYSESTKESVEGVPIKDDEVPTTVPGQPAMTVKEYRDYMEKLSQDGNRV